MTQSPRLLFWVQNLLGSGHLKRQLMIAEAAVRKGCKVSIANGGPPSQFAIPAGLEWHQLPPLKSQDQSFKQLVDAQGLPVDDDYWAKRQTTLRSITTQFHPDIVVTEMFPFGRRKFRQELTSWFDFMGPLPKITCSLRDILVTPKKTGRLAETCDTVWRYYDTIFVHSDPAIQCLDDTFPRAPELQEKLHYTGYVVDADLPKSAQKRWGVCLSVGSGIVGAKLIELAIACRKQGLVAARPWLIVAGSQANEVDLKSWQQEAGPELKIVRFRPDLPAQIAAADLSVSQAGYNTIAETLAVGTPMVLVPFETPTEDEQIKRAHRIEALGRAVVIREQNLTIETLARAIEQAAQMRHKPVDIELDGAARTANMLIKLAGRSS